MAAALKRIEENNKSYRSAIRHNIDGPHRNPDHEGFGAVLYTVAGIIFLACFAIFCIASN